MNNLTQTLDAQNITSGQAAAAGAVLGGMFGVVIVAGLAIAILMIIAMWKLFAKAGEKGWKSLIPIYNVYILFKIVGMKVWFWIYLLVTIGVAIVSGVVSATGGAIVDANGQVTGFTNPTAGTVMSVVSVAAAIFELFVGIMLCYKLAKAFSRGIGTTIGLIFLPNIFLLILAFGSAKYNKKAVCGKKK